MRRLPFRDLSFDVCISMFTSLGYFGKVEDELAVLGEMHRVLKPGGHCFVDHGNLVWLKRHLQARSVRMGRRFTTLETRAFLEDGRTVEKRIRVYPAGLPASRISRTSPLREYRERVTFFTRRELGGLITRAGLEVVRAFGDYPGSAFGEGTSPRLMILSRKRK